MLSIRAFDRLAARHNIVGPSRAFLLTLILLTALAGCRSTLEVLSPPSPAGAAALQRTVDYLASDELDGRGLGSGGLEQDAAYIESYFRALGLTCPPGQSQLVQDFEYRWVSGQSAESYLRLGATQFSSTTDFAPLAISPEGRFGATAVFVGYGISQPQADYDDYAGVDVTGKVVLMLADQPVVSATGKRLPMSAGSIVHKAKVAAAHGAVAVLLVGQDPLTTLTPIPTPTTESLQEIPGQPAAIPTILITRKTADALLAASRLRLRDLQAELAEHHSPCSVALPKTALSGNVQFRYDSAALKNICAFLPGRGRHADQVIVVGAHYDHLGHGGLGSRQPGSRAIHPGADDNASGVAAMLELARILSYRQSLDRSVLFIAFSGEERGVIGSQYWVAHPSVPLERVKAMVNLDMVGRMADQTVTIGGTATAGAFRSLAEQTADALALTLRYQWDDGLAPSDSLPFAMRQIPVLLFFSGMHADHHRPGDTADKINAKGEGQIVDLAGRIIIQLSRMVDFSTPLPTIPKPLP